MRYAIIFLGILCFSCSVDKEVLSGTLEAAINETAIVRDNIIACAASNVNDDRTSVFLYPRVGATNIRYFETRSATSDKNDFSEYDEYDVNPQDVFNGYLKKIETRVEEGAWVIVTFEEDDKVHLCNPIRIKKDSKPTEVLNDGITITNSRMPTFSWPEGIYDDTIIYFQVVSDANDNLLSGTYTEDRTFQYYNTINVVLNVTRETPPELEYNLDYNFTLMGVSEDNWVNLFVEIPFVLEED
ncbi:hypothetical protein [Aurantibacter sp.]|uniref:hypothetical protein n=1 Tax=Aurantibacter sp. TaxID=2807103 RepID=UPI0032652B32